MPPGPIHLHASAVVPVVFAAVRERYLPVVMGVCCILPFLDSFEVLCTTRAVDGYRSHTAHIFAWHRAYMQKLHSGFVPDPVHKTVCTSTGRMIYPDLGTVMCLSFLTVLSVTNTSSNSPAMASVYRDIDSLVCILCGNSRHEKANCHKKQKKEKKLPKHAFLGASAANQWVWVFC